jgi:hypothetical protein
MTNTDTQASESLEQVFHQLLTMPLYQPFGLPEVDTSKFARSLRLYQAKFDCYCPECGKEATWERLIPKGDLSRDETEKATTWIPLGTSAPHFPSWHEDFHIRLICMRDRSHVATYYFATIGGNQIVKIGQYPSLTDFQIGDIDHLNDGFTKEQKSDFIKAINTMAHGFNVAACVYLRRVFESIITETKIAHMKSHGMEKWDDFDNAIKVNEQIALLRKDLPKFMSENPTIYRLLSKGVHELTEKECAEELPILKKSIEVIISDRIEQLRAKKNRDELTKMIAQRVDHHENK